MDLEGAGVLLERLRSSLAETRGGNGCPVTASIGAVWFAAPPASVDEFVGHADRAMDTAKSTGRNRVRLRTVGPASQVGSPTAEAASSARRARGNPAQPWAA
jgi:hypothetical protein